MSKMANSRRAGLSARPPVAERGLRRPSRAVCFRGSSATRRRQTGALAAGLALTLGLLLCGSSASAGQAQVAIVVLEPQFISGGGGEATAAAQLACDRLARELEKNASLRVVDRTQLDRVLNERRLGSGPAGMILSYDIMVRLEVDAVRPVPRTILKFVGLSDGNLLAEMQFAWSVPLPDGAIRNMAGACQAAARRLAGPGEKAVRVRLLEVDNPAKSTRLEPLAIRLRDAVAGALARSEGVRPVHHLEATTAKEESLLLTLGLSKLLGDRQFTPQSDATIELRIRELDGIGKTFEQTRMEIAWRISKAGGSTADAWSSAEATVADFDQLVRDAWARIAAEIGKTAPGAGNDFLNELALRRRQAQAELDAAPKGFYLPRDQAIKRLEHLAVAVKIDPTWEEPAYQLVHANLVDFEKPLGYGPPIREAARYLRRFPGDRDRRSSMASDAFSWSSSRFLKLRYFPSTDPRDIEKLDADAREVLDDLKQIVDTFAAGPAEDMPEHLPFAMHIVYRAMAQSGVPADQRRQWMDRLVRVGSENVSLVTHSPHVHEEKLLETRIFFRTRAAGLLLAEGAGDQARKYLEELVPLLAASNRSKGDFSDFFRQVEKLKEPAMLARLEAALTETVSPLRINWPQFRPWQPKNDRAEPRVRVRSAGYDKRAFVTPLIQCAGREYCIVREYGPKDEPRVGFVALDGRGGPTGKIELLSAQPATFPREVFSKAVVKGRVYLGTADGLLEYDPAKDAWRAFGLEQGLPHKKVTAILPLETGVLFCQSQGQYGWAALFLIDPATTVVKLLHRWEGKSRSVLSFDVLRSPWQAGEQIMGFAGDVRLVTVPALGAAEPASKNWPGPNQLQARYGSSVYATASAEGRRFALCRDAFREIDDSGKVLRTWVTELFQDLAVAGDGELPRHEIVLLNDVPDPLCDRTCRSMTQDSSHLFFTDDRIFCYEPPTDTWYGPLGTEPWTGSEPQGGGGIWISSGPGLVYVNTVDFIAAARTAGRALTSEQFRQKRDEFFASRGPLEQAKAAAAMKQWQKARDLAAAALDKEPKNAEALLLMGLLHESCCLNEPEKAMEYYARLAAMDNDPCVALAGLAHQYRMLHAAGRAKEALEIGRDIERRYPRNSFRDALARCNRQLAKQIEGKSK